MAGQDQAHDKPSQTLETGESPIQRPVAKSFPPSVRLNVLCPRCTSFCKRWDVLDYMQHRTDDDERPTFTPTLLGKMSLIFETAASCHLCNLLSNYFKDRLLDARLVIKLDMLGRLDYRLRLDDDVYLCGYQHKKYGVFTGFGFEDSLERLSKGIVLLDFSIDVAFDLPGRGFQNNLGQEHGFLFARDAISCGKEWIDTCVRDHECCRQFQSNTVDDCRERPTRVLEITEHAVRLRCDMSNQIFDYLVLSHVWGDPSKQIRLLQENIADFQIDIPLSTLSTSDVFLSAVTSTRALGYRYLWIDSLCIIQDCNDDWTYESRRMAAVYGNAVCCLAHIYPPKPTPTATTISSGVPADHANLHANPKSSRDPRTWSPCILRRPDKSVSPHLPGVYIRLDFDALSAEMARNNRRIWLNSLDWPLFQRAWAFQEYLLSPRTLFLGAQNLMYQCSLGFYDELCGRLRDSVAFQEVETIPNQALLTDRRKSDYFPSKLLTVREEESFSSLTLWTLLANWYMTVSEYRRRVISHHEDRVVAFTGIAKAVTNMGNLTYVGGMWTELMPLCLLWYVCKKPYEYFLFKLKLNPSALRYKEDMYTNEVQEPATQLAPSWSWLSVPEYKYFCIGFLLDYDIRMSPREKCEWDPPLACWDEIIWTRALVVNMKDGERQKTSEYFELSEAYVYLMAHYIPTFVNLCQEAHSRLDKIRKKSKCQDDHNLTYYTNLQCFPDDPWTKAWIPFYDPNSIFVQIYEFQSVSFQDRTISRFVAGLVLTPQDVPEKNELDCQNVWKRIGVWKLQIDVKDVPITRENMTTVAERWRRYRVTSRKWNRIDVFIS